MGTVLETPSPLTQEHEISMNQATKQYRTIRYRLHPRTQAKHDLLAQTAGACRHVWNHFHARNKHQYRISCNIWTRGLPQYKRPSVSFFSLSAEFTEYRKQTEWLQTLPFVPVRHALRDYAEAWKRAFKYGGFPKFRARGKSPDSFTIPQGVKATANALYIPKIGWCKLSRKGGNPYQGCQAVKATVKRIDGKWYVTVAYEVTDDRTDNGLAVGVDMNVGQVATSTGDIIRLPDMALLEARRKRYQRRMERQVEGSKRRQLTKDRLARISRKIANARHNWAHHTSRTITDTAGLVVIEGLKTKNMTRTAKGTADAPGRNVKQKAGLNREILNTGWYQLRRMLEYKAYHVEAVNAAYTSQSCNECGTIDKDNRKTQSQFKCVSCGHEANADVNAALNILASGVGASGRRGALVLSGYPADPSISTSQIMGNTDANQRLAA